MKRNSSFEVVYQEMIENENGLYSHGTPLIFQGHDDEASTRDRDWQSLKSVADSWACWMRSKGYDIFELPRTTRTRDWGLTYSITAKGEKSRIFVLRLE